MTGGSLDARVRVRRRGDFVLDAAVRAEPGDVVAVMGPSGAGKSTLLEAVAGLVRLSGGSIRLDGSEIATARRHVPPAVRGIVLLGQEPRLFPHLTARANVAFGPRAHGVPREVAHADADEWLWRVGLPGAGSHRPAELSGGQQQRVAIARALATDPKLLLLDEPLTALDPETAGEIRTVLHEQFHATHATAVVVTHDVVDAAALARRLIVVEDGRITQEGAVHDVLSVPATRFVASVAGMNRLIGAARAGAWTDGELTLRATDATAATDGEGLAALFRPGAVRVDPVEEQTWTGALRLARHAHPSPGSWLARIVRMEQTPGGVRLHTAEPAVAVDLAADSPALRGLVPGAPVRLHLDPRDVRLAPVTAEAPAPGTPAPVPAEADGPPGAGGA